MNAKHSSSIGRRAGSKCDGIWNTSLNPAAGKKKENSPFWTSSLNFVPSFAHEQSEPNAAKSGEHGPDSAAQRKKVNCWPRCWQKTNSRRRTTRLFSSVAFRTPRLRRARARPGAEHRFRPARFELRGFGEPELGWARNTVFVRRVSNAGFARRAQNSPNRTTDYELQKELDPKMKRQPGS